MVKITECLTISIVDGNVSNSRAVNKQNRNGDKTYRRRDPDGSIWNTLEWIRRTNRSMG